MAEPSKQWTPNPGQITRALQHVAWEYVALLAAAREMARGHGSPVNHEVQESFLVHVRNLAEFFWKGVRQFKQAPGTLVPRNEEHDNIYAVDFRETVKWDEAPFHRETKLRRAIDKTLSHMTYSRDLQGPQLDAAFDGCYHLHGTVKLIRRTWQDFRSSLRAKSEEALDDWIGRQANGLKLSVDVIVREFEQLARERAAQGEWRLNETPDGPVRQYPELPLESLAIE
jgi:hypothetical protein